MTLSIFRSKRLPEGSRVPYRWLRHRIHWCCLFTDNIRQTVVAQPHTLPATPANPSSYIPTCCSCCISPLCARAGMGCGDHYCGSAGPQFRAVACAMGSLDLLVNIVPWWIITALCSQPLVYYQRGGRSLRPRTPTLWRYERTRMWQLCTVTHEHAFYHRGRCSLLSARSPTYVPARDGCAILRL